MAALISQLKLKGKFRSLGESTFQENTRFGKRTIIYGHNGSGKSSLAELLYQISKGGPDVELTIRDKEGKSIEAPADRNNLSMGLFVFCKSWITSNVASFQDGEDANAITALGAKAKESKEKENLLASQIAEIESEVLTAKQRIDADNAQSQAIVRRVQDEIDGNLRNFDYRKFTKNRYNETRVRQLLTESTKDALTEHAYAEFLALIEQDLKDNLTYVKFPQVDIEALTIAARELISRRVEGELIESITGNTILQNWLEEGLQLHKGSTSCQYCLHELEPSRTEELKRHFNRSRKDIQNQASRMRSEIKSQIDMIEAWSGALPAEEELYPELVESYMREGKTTMIIVEDLKAVLHDIDAALECKYNDPENTSISIPSASTPSVGEAISQLVDQHNRISNTLKNKQEQAADTICEHYVSTNSDQYRKSEASKSEYTAQLKSLENDRETAKETLKRVESEKFTTKTTAEKISRDLKIVYGRSYLSIEVSDDGKTYRCLRDEEPAFDLSEGERNTLALVYFLRYLEDEQHNVPKEKMIVVIDDPSSSLDREAMFATHSWLLRTLKEYGQSVVTTHDFELLRLFLNSQTNQLNKHTKIINDGNNEKATQTAHDKAKKEAQFPKISFLEMINCYTRTEQRQSQLIELSPVFTKYKSEYHFLFERLLTGIEQTEQHQLLFLLPNVSRRVLETFVSFQVPELQTFDQQLARLTLDECDQEFRDVYDFCNRFSHGEGREHTTDLDSTTISRGVRRSLELIQATDAHHFESMCKATGRTKFDPLTGNSWA